MKDYKNEYITISHYFKLSDLRKYINVTDLVSNKTVILAENRFGGEYTLFENELSPFSVEAIERELSLKETYPDEFFNLTLACYTAEELREELKKRKKAKKPTVFDSEVDAINAALKSLGYPSIQTVRKKGWKPREKRR